MAGLALIALGALAFWALVTIVFDRFGSHGRSADLPSEKYYHPAAPDHPTEGPDRRR